MTDAARERWRIRAPLLAASGVAWIALIARPVCSIHSSFRELALHSALMFAAMMLPLINAPVRHVHDRSLPRRRVRAMALFVTAYGLLWTGAGIVLMRVDALAPAAAILVAVALWQVSPAKQRCLNRCHNHSELAAFGIAADLDVLRFGFVHASWCIASCSGLMLLPMLVTRGQVAAMAAMTLWLALEKLERPAAPQWALRGPVKGFRLAHYWLIARQNT